MMIIREISPTRSSKKKCLLLICLIIGLYFLDSPLITSFVGALNFNNYLKPLLWSGLALLVWMFPKVRPEGKLRFRGFVNWWGFNFGIIFVIISAMAGLIDGFGKSPYSHSLKGILFNVLGVGSVLVAREFVRSYIVNDLTDDENYRVFILVALFMTLTSIHLRQFTEIKGYVSLVKFIAEYLAPQFSHNLLATYLVFIGGPIASIIYLGIVEGFNWLSPILPDLKWITKAFIGVLIPIFFFILIQSSYLKASKKVKKRLKDKESPLSWILTSLASIFIIWFAVGVFPVYPSVIATGSMEPMIKPGDVILVKKLTNESVKELQEGDVIQFRKDNILISHRIIDIIEDEELGLGYKTKGDNNSVADSDLVMPEQLKGKIVKVVPKIGWPTLLLKNKDDVPLEEVVF